MGKVALIWRREIRRGKLRARERGCGWIELREGYVFDGKYYALREGYARNEGVVLVDGGFFEMMREG